MTQPIDNAQAKHMVAQHFQSNEIVADLEVRAYPEETIILAHVRQRDVARASEIANALDEKLQSSGFDGFVTVRGDLPFDTHASHATATAGIADPRATEFANLLTARSRTSRSQPSLSYIPDTAQNLSVATTARHHLIFGRRGAGKTALLLEAQRNIEQDDNLTVWANIQTYRNETSQRVVAYIVQKICQRVQSFFKERATAPSVLHDANSIEEQLSDTLRKSDADPEEVMRLIPQINGFVQRFLECAGIRLYVILDDFHYLVRTSQPETLDLVHACIRDCDAWLKIAAIRHLAKWYDTDAQLGLETGHDADHIDLDITLKDPERAKRFLERVLRSYANHVGISALSSIISTTALDRLVLASGAVPRDYLTLSASAVRNAQLRTSGRLVGVQDVNKAAGDAAKTKLSEVEDDTAASGDLAQSVSRTLQYVRRFCLDTKRYTFFRIDFRDKEVHSAKYIVLQRLMDLRLLHLINPSVSDERQAGRRSEIYLLDLSQYSGQRLKQRIRVLDFQSGCLISRETGRSGTLRRGDTPNKLLGILRRAPVFPLQDFNQEGATE